MAHRCGRRPEREGDLNLSGKRIALVGGAGFIGSHVVEQLLREPVAEIVVFDNFVRGKRENLPNDARVKVVEASMEDAALVYRTLEGAAGVFLLASLWLGECVSCPRDAWEVNVLGTYNVVEACRRLGVEQVVYSSSASVYGNAVGEVMREDHPLNNRTTYGATKIACEQMLRATNEQHGLPYVALRYMNVYGPRMDRLGTYVSVIMKALDRIFAGERPIIYGDGNQTYDFVDVEDVARANVLAMQSECTDASFNVGTGVGTSVNRLVETLLEITGSDLAPEYQDSVQSFVTRRVGSTEKAERLLGFRSLIGLREGLEKLVAWRKAQG